MPNPPPVTADVLIVTVTPVESRAVLNAFKQATGKESKTITLDGRYYRELGEINGVQVFMALSEMGAGGLGAALQTVQKGIAALNPHAVIMVGIAFGIDEEKQSIGDILVSKQLMLYDSQKISRGEIIPRGDRPSASTRLMNFLKNAHLDWEEAEVRFGLVLTGEKLVDDLDYRESLKKLEPETVGGEMEGAGLYVACQEAKVDWVLVKAICDWADGNKDQDKKARQQKAAENAAAFVLFALQHAPLERPEGRSGFATPTGTFGSHAITQNLGDGVTNPVTLHPAEPTRSTLPHQPYFFGRKKELETIAEAIAPEARTWGALIDGPGGIGKTALAVRAGHLASVQQFPLKLFLSAKVRELTPQGEQPLTDSMLPSFQELLKELARGLGEEGIERVNPEERAKIIRNALAGRRALLVIDNVETFPEPERVRLYQFLSLLPVCCKAIVTSRRRSDIDARAIRLDRLSLAEALDFLAELARDNRYLQRADEAGRRQLYEHTNGNPLLIRWVIGQLGRTGSQCSNIDEACAFLDQAPQGNDPLEYVFGDLLDTFTENESAVLAALTHFDGGPAKLESLEIMAGLARPAALTALEDLADRALLVADAEAKTFFLPRYAGTYLRHKRPEAVAQAGERLANRVYALVVENGYQKIDRFPVLENGWANISLALPLLVEGENGRLQNVCQALHWFMEFYGYWDERFQLSQQAEERAKWSGDLINAGWRAYQAGWIQAKKANLKAVMECADRCENYWKNAERIQLKKAKVLELRGQGYLLGKNYLLALESFDEALLIYQNIDTKNSFNVNYALAHKAIAERFLGNFSAAERHTRDALRSAMHDGHLDEVAMYMGQLAEFMLAQKNWAGAETLARDALVLSEKICRQLSISRNCYRLSLALAHQNRHKEGLPLAQRAVDIFTRLRMPGELEQARAALRVCGGEPGQPAFHQNEHPSEQAHDPTADSTIGTTPARMADSPRERGGTAGGLPPQSGGVHAELHGLGERAGQCGALADAADSTRPVDATRELATSVGALTYTEVAERLAVNIARCLTDLFDGAPEELAITPDWIADIHRRIAGELFPDWAGRFPPPMCKWERTCRPRLMRWRFMSRTSCLDLDERLRHLGGVESIAELLAWVDWRFQWIHPFKDLNGRVGRILLSASTFKLGLPPVDPSVAESDKLAYFNALRSADAGNLAPMKEIWLERLASE